MKIRKFIARTIQEGREKILAELGNEAIILSTRVLPPAPPEMEELIEFVAAVDKPDEEINRKKIEKDSLGKDINKEDFLAITSQVIKEITTLKEMVWKLSEKISYKFLANLETEYSELATLMVSNGYTSDFILNFIQNFKNVNYSDFEDLRQKAVVSLAKKIVYEKPLKKNSKCQSYLFIGPTGVGKTLTIIKLGILYKILLESRVAIISCDTRKVGGWEQMQVISAISSIPAIFCQTKSEFFLNYESFRNYDFILVDTSGGSQKDKEYLEELTANVEMHNWDRIFLTLSVTSDKLNFKDNVSVFKEFKPTNLILTKFDEVATIGHIYETLCEISQEIPLAYLSLGVEIPNSIEPAKEEILGKFLINYLPQ
ncbi:MAG: hypothetical protein N2517_02270 [Ignavibacteria bacterium]|nr:hypothetical protein [Ignavibacteria bacterium]